MNEKYGFSLLLVVTALFCAAESQNITTNDEKSGKGIIDEKYLP